MWKGRKSDNRKAKRWDEKVKFVTFFPRKSSESVSESKTSEEFAWNDPWVDKKTRFKNRKKRKRREKWKEIFPQWKFGLGKAEWKAATIKCARVEWEGIKKRKRIEREWVRKDVWMCEWGRWKNNSEGKLRPSTFPNRLFYRFLFLPFPVPVSSLFKGKITFSLRKKVGHEWMNFRAWNIFQFIFLNELGNSFPSFSFLTKPLMKIQAFYFCSSFHSKQYNTKGLDVISCSY